MEKRETPATATVRVELGAVKTHGPNSPDVISGRYPLGYRETLETEGPTLQEVDYPTAVSMFGKEEADKMFAGVSEEDRNG